MATGLQDIIDRCNGITIDRRKVVGIQITRNEIARTALTPTRQPWRMVLDMPSSYKYSDARALLEALDSIDRYVPQTITFSNNPKLSWIFRYQGVMNSTDISNLRVTSFAGNQLILNTLPTVTDTAVLFYPNDLIQLGSIPHPFTVVNTVTRGLGSTVTLTTNRPNIISSNVVGQTVTVGNACQFLVFCPNMPVYKLLPGGWTTSSGVTLNNAYIEFSDSFELMEYTANA